MKFKFVILFLGISLSTVSLAHEGHSETSLKSIHGGIVKKTSNAFIEILQEDGKIEIFVTGHDYKNIIVPKLAFSATAQTKTKSIPLVLLVENDHYIVANDLKNEKHFKLNIVLRKSGKEEKTSFALENQ
ncbi:MAG: hypothetical protein Q7U04_09860 [Bacteriovorax sp.]|nr:hypothetical protein [Bacteriovorax sp.]